MAPSPMSEVGTLDLNRASDAKSKAALRGAGFQWKFPGNVRLHGLRLLRLGDWLDFLPEQRPFRLVDLVADDFRCGLPDAASGSDRPGSVHRCSWAPKRFDSDLGIDVVRYRHHRMHAGIRDDRAVGAGPGSVWDDWCRDSPQEWNWAECQCTCPKLPLQDTKGFM